jgi:hypothetical protein
MSKLAARPSRAPSVALLRFLKAQTSSQAPTCVSAPGSGGACPIRLISRPSISALQPQQRQLDVSGRFNSGSKQSPPENPVSFIFGHRNSNRRCQPNTTFGLSLISLSYHTIQRRCLSLWEWPLKRKPNPSLHPHDLPPLASFLGDNATFGRIPKPSHELILKCTELDAHGKVTLMDGEFKKTELIANVFAQDTYTLICYTISSHHVAHDSY